MFNQLASLLGFLILFNPFFLGYLLVPASAVEKSSGTITGDARAKSGNLLLHSGFVLNTPRDVRPRSVVLITMLDYYCPSWSLNFVMSLSMQCSVILGDACGLHIWFEFVRLRSSSKPLCRNFVKSVLQVHCNKCFKSKQCNYCQFKNLHRRHVSVDRRLEQPEDKYQSCSRLQH